MSEEERTTAAISARLTVLKGGSRGTVLTVESFPVVVGRGKEADLRLQDDPSAPTLSRAHIQLAVAGGRLILEDLSTNGTAVEGQLLKPGERVSLGPRETIELGPTTVLLVETIYPRERPEAGELLRSGPGIPLPITTLGDWSARLAGLELGPKAWTHRRSFLVLVYLAGASPHSVSVVRLWEVFWPDDPTLGRKGLQSTVSRLRGVFRQANPELPNPVLLRDQAYQLDPAYAPELDASLFEQACASGRQALRAGQNEAAERVLRRALTYYRGDFLRDFPEAWAERRRVQLRGEFFTTLTELARLASESDRLEQALDLLRRGISLDPAWEEGQLGLLTVLAGLDRRHEAVFAFEEYERHLKRVLGTSPSPELLEFYRCNITGS